MCSMKILKRYQASPIARQLMVAVSVVCALCVVLLSVNAYVLSRQQMINGSIETDETMLHQVRRKLDSDFLMLENILYMISCDARVQAFSESTKEGHSAADVRGLCTYLNTCADLANYDRYQPQSVVYNSLIDDVMLITQTDTIIARRTNLTAYSIHSLLETEPFQRARQHKRAAIWTPPLHLSSQAGSATLENQVMLVSYLTSDSGEGDIGYLAISVSLENLCRLIEEAAEDSNRAMYIVDAEGSVVAAKNREMLLTPLEEGEEEAAWLANPNEKRVFNAVVEDTDVYLYSTPLLINNWRLILTTPEETINRRAINIFLPTAGLGILWLCLITLVCVTIIGGITGPIQRLTDSIRQIQTQYIPQRIAVDGCQEARLLCDAYNVMLERIEHLRGLIEEEQKEVRNAQLNFFRAQINPHFLYNTLDTVKWLIKDRRYDQAERLVVMLSAFFRLALSGGMDEIPLREEISHVVQYLKIQQIRIGSHLEYLIDCDLEDEALIVPKLILQPIVENSILHGYSQAKGEMCIALLVDVEEKLTVTIVDDGIGMDEPTLSSVKQRMEVPLSQRVAQKHGYALRNVHQRIRLTFGSEYGLSVQSRAGEGTRVTVTLPVQRAGQESGASGYEMG